MKKILLIVMMVAVAVQAAPTYKVVYIVNQRDTTTHNANVDSIRYDMVNDPQHQLPGTWRVDLLSKDSVLSRSSAFWNDYNLIITWGSEEGSGSESGDSTDYDTFLAARLDTMHKPIIARNAWIANGSPMRLGTAARATTSRWGKLDNTTHFITRDTYTDNYNYGDSFRVYSSTDQSSGSLRGMANGVVTLVRWDGEIRSDDADTALVAILDSGATNASGTAAPHRRAFFALNSSWRYSSWAARDMWFKMLRWAVTPPDTVIDTCRTQIMIAREAIDANFLEYSGSACQTSWHYGGFTNGLLTGYDVRDRATMIRARSRALQVCMPDTSASKSYDMNDAELWLKIKGIAENVPSNSFSFWEGLFEINYASTFLWYDYKPTSIQLDSTCGSWVSTERHDLTNSSYLQYPAHPWNSAQASTRGTDYKVTAFDSIYIQDPVLEQYLVFGNLKVYIDSARADSATNQGLITHTIGTPTSDAEISVYTENDAAAYASVRNSPLFIIPITWRDANAASGDLDSAISFLPDSSVFENTYVNGSNPHNINFTLDNGASSATFTCGSFTVRPTASWFSYFSLGSATPYYVIGSADVTGLSAGYYSTWFVPTCSGVADDSCKIILNVLPEPGRTAGGWIQRR